MLLLAYNFCMMKRVQKTQGQIKLDGYFKEISKKEDFKKMVSHLKTIYQDKDFTSNEELRKTYWREIYLLCKENNLPPYPWREVIDEIVRKNRAPKDLGVRFDMCTIRSFLIEENASSEDIEHYNKQYPLAICISPYATIQDIKNFLDKRSDLIRSLLENHQEYKNVIKHYKRRNPSKMARDEFIFNNRHKSRKEVSELVSAKYGLIMGYDDVGKIIQREKKRRGIK
jgi:patatin-like phospholipase/acyl hydrolase